MKYLLISAICFLSVSAFCQTEIELRTDGIVVPRMETASVNSPSVGQVIYDTLTAQLMFYNGNNWITLSGAFERNGTTVRQKEGYDSDDFVFGREALPPDTPIRDTLFFFDKSKGAFRGGFISEASPDWSEDSLGMSSFAFGESTSASGDYGATALGDDTEASGNYGATALGTGSVASGEDGATALGNGTIASGDYGATAMGSNSVANGDYGATALGYFSEASGENGTTALGYYTRASGYSGATAIGHFTLASGNNGATAMGSNTIATGNSVTVVGINNDTIVAAGTSIADLSPLFIVGNGSQTNRSNALVIKKNGEVSYENYTFPIADGTASQILSTDGSGQLSWVSASSDGAFEKSGNLVHQVTDVDADDFIFGRSSLPPAGNITDKFFFYDQLSTSFRGGILTNSNNWNFRGESSFGYGENVAPSGDRSTAFGLGTLAVGENTFAIGEETKAEAINSVAIGRFNEGGGNATSWAATDPLFEIGIGTGDLERENALTVLKNGKVGMGNTAPDSQLHQNYNSNSGDAHIKLTEEGADGARIILENDQNDNLWTIYGRPYTTAASSRINIHYNDVSGSGTETGNKFQIFGNGDATLEGTLTQNSDRRLKKKIERLENSLALIQAINGYTYQWKNEQTNANTQVGVLAQEVQKVLPEIIKTSDEGTLSVSYTSLVPVLIEGIKEQQEQIESVLKENAKLKKEIEEIKAYLKM